MKIIYALIILITLGCIFSYKRKKGLRESGLTGKTFTRTFTISIDNPIDKYQKMELISINENGSATIRTLYSNETLTAKPSEYLIGEDFGLFGLRLMSISRERQEVQLRQTAPEHIE